MPRRSTREQNPKTLFSPENSISKKRRSNSAPNSEANPKVKMFKNAPKEKYDDTQGNTPISSETEYAENMLNGVLVKAVDDDEFMLFGSDDEPINEDGATSSEGYSPIPSPDTTAIEPTPDIAQLSNAFSDLASFNLEAKEYYGEIMLNNFIGYLHTQDTDTAKTIALEESYADTRERFNRFSERAVHLTNLSQNCASLNQEQIKEQIEKTSINLTSIRREIVANSNERLQRALTYYNHLLSALTERLNTLENKSLNIADPNAFNPNETPSRTDLAKAFGKERFNILSARKGISLGNIFSNEAETQRNRETNTAKLEYKR